MITLGTQEWIGIVLLSVGATWYFSRCHVAYEIKMNFRYWINRKVPRWLDHRFDEAVKWNKTMTRGRCTVVGLASISAVYLPVMVMNLSIDPLQRSLIGMFGLTVITAEYIFINGLVLYFYFRKSKSKQCFTNPPHSQFKESLE